jgi:hypothetical protein
METEKVHSGLAEARTGLQGLKAAVSFSVFLRGPDLMVMETEREHSVLAEVRVLLTQHTRTASEAAAVVASD